MRMLLLDRRGGLGRLAMKAANGVRVQLSFRRHG
jgi:hypothetical protein